jgi:hypothetical protein
MPWHYIADVNDIQGSTPKHSITDYTNKPFQQKMVLVYNFVMGEIKGIITYTVQLPK